MANKIDLVQTEIIRIRIRVQTLEREAISKDAELLLKREEIGSLQGFDQTRVSDAPSTAELTSLHMKADPR